MGNVVRSILLLALGAGLFWGGTNIRDELNAQSQQLLMESNQYNPNNNFGLLNPTINPQLPGQQATVSRPLEVPPLYAFGTMIDADCLQLAIVDGPSKQISVYWIQKDGNKSSIEWKAARGFEYDLQIKEFNVQEPTPSQIRDELEQSRQ